MGIIKFNIWETKKHIIYKKNCRFKGGKMSLYLVIR